MGLRFLSPVRKAKGGGRGKPTQRALDILGRHFEGVMRADIKGAFSTFAKGVDYETMREAVYSGDWRKVYETLPLDDLDNLLTDGMQGAGRAMVRSSEVEAEGLGGILLPEGGIATPSSLSVGLDNDKVLDYIHTRTGELMQNVTNDLQVNVQTAVAVGVENRLSPREVATLVRDKLPLNNRQQGSYERYVAGLAATNLSAKRQGELAERMRNALADERATTIARTEAQYAISAGQKAVWDEAQDQGLIGGDTRKRWTVEAEPCDKCSELDGVTVLVNEPFVVPSTGESVDTPPLHPNCRCQSSIIPSGDLGDFL